MALTDSLTGLYNRRYFEVYLQKLLHKNNDAKKKLCVLLFDIDHFKQVNDQYGHGVGDEVLKVFAFRLQDKLRSFDLVARLGGEEFVVILPDITDDMAQFIAERLRRSIAEEPIVCGAPGGSLRITTSIGGALIGLWRSHCEGGIGTSGQNALCRQGIWTQLHRFRTIRAA